MKFWGFWLLFIGTATAFWFDDLAPSDCIWKRWEEVKCVKTVDNDFRMLEKREKIDAINGGKPCKASDGTRMITQCDGPSYVTSTVIETISSLGNVGVASLSSGGGSGSTSGGGASKPDAPNKPKSNDEKCAKSFTDSSTGLTMRGADCDSAGRRRRSVLAEMAKSRIRRQFGAPVPDYDNKDVLFMIDTSGSVGSENFKKEIAMVKSIVGESGDKGFCGAAAIGQLKTRVAVMTFDDVPRLHINFHDHFKKGSFLKALDLVPHTGGYTCLINALNEVRDKMFTKAKGSRVENAEAEGLVILITDGCLNCRGGDAKEELIRQQKSFTAKGISIVTFLVGVDTDSSCAKNMQGLGDGSRCYQEYLFKNWIEFENLARNLTSLVKCIDHWTKLTDECL